MMMMQGAPCLAAFLRIVCTSIDLLLNGVSFVVRVVVGYPCPMGPDVLSMNHFPSLASRRNFGV
jgi:hypothetical protein